MLSDELKTAYRFHRSAYPARPSIALQRAKSDVEAGKRRYASGYWWSPCRENIGNPQGVRWIEKPSSVGFRFVGFADEVSRREGYFRAIDHTGWFTDSDFFEVYRGAVYQLPARNGKPLYYAAYREGYDGKSGWKDTAYDSDYGAAGIDFSEIHDCPMEAARAADGLAEKQAKDSREYNDAWRAANQWYELGESMQAKRREARQLVRDMREAIKSGISAAPSICNALRAQLRRLLEQWETMREEREELESNFYYWQDGKRIAISDFPI